MATITLEIPDELISQIMQLGERFPEWLMVNLPDSNLYPPVTSLSDDQVRDLARLKLSLDQNDRLGELQAKGKTADLAEVERCLVSLNPRGTRGAGAAMNYWRCFRSTNWVNCENPKQSPNLPNAGFRCNN
jgi:hypothetical protein